MKSGKRGWGRVGVSFGALGLLAVACGDGFGTANCEESRTCAMSPGGQDGEGGGDDDVSGSGGTSGTGGSSGSGGTGAPGGGDGNVGGCTSDCDPADAAPRVVSITPEPNSDAVEPNASVVIELSEPLNAATVTKDSVQLRRGDVQVSGKLSYAESVITFVPDLPLTLAGAYEVVVTDTVADETGVPLAAPYSSAFTVRDGTWHVVDAMKGPVRELAATAQLSANGSLLLAWSGSADAGGCPMKASWLGLGETSVTPQPFQPSESYCISPLSAVSESGNAIVAWSAAGLGHIQQQRAGKWNDESLQVTTSSEKYTTSVGVSPLGVTTRVEGADVGGLVAWRTNTEGEWQPSADTLAGSTIYPQSAPSIDFDGEGNGLMAFVAYDQNSHPRIMASRYTVASGKWSTALDVPDSVDTVNKGDGTRGAPVVELAESGEGMVVWRKGPVASGTLMSNYFLPNGGWSRAEALGSSTKVSAINGSAGLTFDGARFVAAWQGTVGNEAEKAFTASYDPAQGWSAPESHDAKRLLPHHDFPQVVSDGAGNLLLAWKTSDAPPFTLFQRRFRAGAWGDVEPIPESTREGGYSARGKLVMNGSGVAAITWPHEGEPTKITAIRVARFY